MGRVLIWGNRTQTRMLALPPFLYRYKPRPSNKSDHRDLACASADRKTYSNYGTSRVFVPCDSFSRTFLRTL